MDERIFWLCVFIFPLLLVHSLRMTGADSHTTKAANIAVVRALLACALLQRRLTKDLLAPRISSPHARSRPGACSCSHRWASAPTSAAAAAAARRAGPWTTPCSGLQMGLSCAGAGSGLATKRW